MVGPFDLLSIGLIDRLAGLIADGEMRRCR